MPSSVRSDELSRTVAWSKDDPLGSEFAAVTLNKDGMTATGVAIGSDPEPYRLDYLLECGPGFVTSRLQVATQGEAWWRRIELRRSAEGQWSANPEQGGVLGLPEAGGDLTRFAGVVDPDLGLSPLFNTMPVLRHGLHKGGGAVDLVMVWISVPDLSLHLSPQRYTHLNTTEDDQRVVRFEATGEGEDFVADIVFDADGLVIDYPGIASRIEPRRKLGR